MKNEQINWKNEWDKRKKNKETGRMSGTEVQANKTELTNEQNERTDEIPVCRFVADGDGGGKALLGTVLVKHGCWTGLAAKRHRLPQLYRSSIHGSCCSSSTAIAWRHWTISCCNNNRVPSH